ncbi:MAG TPA: glycoside hydrolase family 57 protein [bacterium]|nr:glycoside hydrolase family 57 protein [bacterium]HQL62287.1 glycoside hydrolase family 57 protein [bacterium]
MSASPRILLCLFWHQHQPPYYDPEAGELVLPWVRLHCTKDYVDMAMLGGRYPKVHQTINLVPSLIEQIHGYEDGSLTDTAWRLSWKPAEDLTDSEKRYLLTNFFDANEQWMIRPHRPYKNLWQRRKNSLERCLAEFTPQEYRDLQVWFNLVWIDPIFRMHPESPLGVLIEKGKNFTEEEKKIVLTEHQRLIAEVVPAHRRFQESGVLEVTTTPFFHPIVPLLCDSNIARLSQPEDRLPSPPFRAPEDAREQVARAMRQYGQEFGRPPRGMWPAEGSVSQEALGILAEAGIEWAATDEAILFASKLKGGKRPQNLYRPYAVETPSGTITLIFRDHKLSDLIGFEYSRFPAERAVDDFLLRVHAIADQQQSLSLVPVILDGENCWEYYPDDGLAFLDALYSRLTCDPEVRCCTVSEALELLPPEDTITDLFPASWINRNFRVWIGGDEDNIAWDCLRQTREALIRERGRLDEKRRAEAWEHIYRAEASDWFWWYGDDHPCVHAHIFDRIFRNRLQAVYQLLGQDPPTRLEKPIRVKGLVAPSLGGRLFRRPNPKGTSFFEWAGTSEYLPGRSGRTMHRTSYEMSECLYGATEDGLAIRLRISSRLAHAFALGRCSIRLICASPVECDIDLTEDQYGVKLYRMDKTLQIFVDLTSILTAPDRAVRATTLEFALELLENGEIIERCPEEGLLSIPLPGPHLHLRRWFV